MYMKNFLYNVTLAKTEIIYPTNVRAKVAVDFTFGTGHLKK